MKEKRLFTQAIVELKIALENNPIPVQAELEDLFETYKSAQNIQSALAIGLALFHVRKEEDLALLLGRYSRQLGEYEQANNLYRQVLKINRSSKLAFNNLAASMGKVDCYDEDIPKLVGKFFHASGLIVPEYLPHTNTIQRIQSNLKKEYLKSKQESLRQLEENIQIEMNEGYEESAEKMLEELNRLIDESEKANYATIKNALHGQIHRKLKENLSAEKQQVLNEDIYNFGLYTLKNKDVEPALESFLILKHKGVLFEELEICLAIAYAMRGKREDALLILTEKIKKSPNSRLLNINMAQLHKAEGNRLLSYKYQIVSASLLEKSGGLILRSEILNRADQYFKQKNLDQALKLYKIIASEKKDINAWLRIGEIHFAKNRQLEAFNAFKEMKNIYPNSPVVQHKLTEIHDIICQQAETLFNDTKFKQSAIVYERALKLVKSPDTIKKLISAYNQLHNTRKAQELSEELESLTEAKRAEGKSEQRQKLITNGKKSFKQKDYESAIYHFENAFKIRPDKDLFAYLSNIYKGLNRKAILQDLIERWNSYKNEHAIEDQPGGI